MYSITKISISIKENSVIIFLLGHRRFSWKNGSHRSKTAMNFFSNFLIVIDSQWFKTYFEIKMTISKIFPMMTFLRETSPFFKNGVIG